MKSSGQGVLNQQSSEVANQQNSEIINQQSSNVNQDGSQLSGGNLSYQGAGMATNQSTIIDEKLSELDKQLAGSKYYYFDREDNSGYSTYKGSIESLDKIASVFPVFFFLVAALICLTTMTRMVEENRTEIGTLKALGYRDYRDS